MFWGSLESLLLWAFWHGGFGVLLLFGAFLRLAFELGLLRSAFCPGHSLVFALAQLALSCPSWLFLTLMSVLPPCDPDHCPASFISAFLPEPPSSNPAHLEPAYSPSLLGPRPELWTSCPSSPSHCSWLLRVLSTGRQCAHPLPPGTPWPPVVTPHLSLCLYFLSLPSLSFLFHFTSFFSVSLVEWLFPILVFFFIINKMFSGTVFVLFDFISFLIIHF